METKYKEVNFTKCKECKHWGKSESEDPCWDCLTAPKRENSTTPLYFEPKEDTK